MKTIYSYSRNQAIEDGFQIKIHDNIRSEAGIKFPVYVTKAVFERYCRFDPFLSHQSLDGRIWDILNMFTYAVKHSVCKSDFISFSFVSQMPAGTELLSNEKISFDDAALNDDINSDILFVLVALHATIGPEDFNNANPAITFMLPNED